jgi:hypothetical protein
LHKILKKRIKQLLSEGKSQSAIALQLCIPRSRVRKLKQEIVQDRTFWNKKKKLLHSHHAMIALCLSKGWHVKKIHTHLLMLNVFLSYSTVARYVAEMMKASNLLKFNMVPGMEAKIYFIPAGKFIKDGNNQKVWVFMMKLSYSKYCFCMLTTNSDFDEFIQCNKKAFAFFQFVPKLIKINCTRAFNINEPVLKGRYEAFLHQFGIRLFEKRKYNCFINCPAEVRFFREQFLLPILHRNYDRLSKDLKRWFSCDLNLGIHPITKRIIEKEFLINERPAMTRHFIKSTQSL